ncbi:MAG TPA: PAS domain S-box protein [Cytophagales bacterium]|nr:PAS domain S-box protein [Cytophagales bacterium]
MLLVVMVAIVGLSFVAFKINKEGIKDKYIQNLSLVGELRAGKIEALLNRINLNLTLIKQREDIKQVFSAQQASADPFLSATSDSSLLMDVASSGPSIDLSLVKSNLLFENLYLIDLQGKVLFKENEEGVALGETLGDPDGFTFSSSKDGIYYSLPFKEKNAHYLYAGAPVTEGDVSKGIVLLKLNMSAVYDIALDTANLGKTGEIIITRLYKEKGVYISPTRYNKSTPLREKNDELTKYSLSGEKGSGDFTDYRKAEVLATWNKIPTANWGIITKIDHEEIYASSKRLLYIILLAGLAILFIASAIAFIFSRMMISPLLNLQGSMQLLGKGILPNEIEKISNDEIGEMASTLSELVEGLKRTASFAHKIGEGNFDADFRPLSDDDTLGTALITMRDSIQDAEKRDKERNWIVIGVAEIGEILRAHTDIEEMGNEIAAYITNKINAIQGAFYVVNDDNPDDVFIEMRASYAYNKKKYLEAKFKFAEGLVGQAAIEQDTLLRTEIPYNYVSITSGLLGDQRPSCILIQPLITNEEVYGVMEFAGFEKFSSSQVKFVQEISVIIARTIFNIKVNLRTKNLLDESTKLSEELQIQQEVLRQNAEEMEATQEELKRTNHALEDQIEEVNMAQKRIQVLLENASEVITIYEKDGKITYISPSVEPILGYSQNEMVGIKDICYVEQGGVDTVKGMFKSLLETPDQKVTITYEYKRKNGESIWLEATGRNMLADPAIKGLVINSRDITERLLAEKESRMRGQMQALSENSPDLITRFNREGKVFYINPIIESYTGQIPNEFLNKELKEVQLDGSLSDQWLKIIGEVIAKNEKIALEMDFPSAMGDRVMQVNAIPEYNEMEDIESILMVSHDITDRKLIELEVQTKNKKITESINYAKRIQGAILPDTALINKVLPESFILYKAKDVVSGDFPWFVQMGDDVYLAAVDCTGHGVPGALISLIGYFLLNDIVKSRKISTPGIILDQLDEAVTKTLRQDSVDSKTKDGMDIALCKINLKSKTVEYAGAHRPLYYMTAEGLEEVKGNKFPIGGGKYKNQTNFTNTKLSVKPGEAIYFCSDGFPDQFGGPENTKFGPRRIREIIQNNHKSKLSNVHKVLDQEWEAWKGDTKQTDDVLMIGVKF